MGNEDSKEIGQELKERDFNKVYSEHYSNIYAQAFKHLRGDVEAVEDVLQKVFLTYYLKGHQYEGRSKLGVWLYSVCRNECNMIFRKRKSGVTKSLDNRDVTEIKETEYRLEHASINTLCCRSMLSRLRQDERQIALLTAAGYTSTEAGHILNLTVPAVKSKLHRIRLKLRKDPVVADIMEFKKAANA